jgi:hypothetical protein
MARTPSKQTDAKRLLASGKTMTPQVKAREAKSNPKDLFNSNMPDENPFQTMYQRTIGSVQQPNRYRPLTTDGRRSVDQEVAKREQHQRTNSQVQFSPYLNSNRKFGQYLGSEEPMFVTGMASNPCKLKCSLTDRRQTTRWLRGCA